MCFDPEKGQRCLPTNKHSQKMKKSLNCEESLGVSGGSGRPWLLQFLKMKSFWLFSSCFPLPLSPSTLHSWHQWSSSMCFQLLQEKLSKHQYNIKSPLAMMDVICGSEGAVEPRLTDLGCSLQDNLMGKQGFLMLAEQKSDGGQQQLLRGISHYVHGCEGSSEVTLTPSLPPSDSRFRCPHLPPAHLLFSWSLAFLFPNGDELFPSLSPVPFTHRLSICKYAHTYVSANYTLAQPNITASHQGSYQKHMSGAGTSLDLQINTEKNQNIMFSIMSAEKLMNNNSINEKRLNSASSLLPTAGKKSTPNHLNFSPSKTGEIVQNYWKWCVELKAHFINRGSVTETKCYGVLAKALLWLNSSCHPAQFYTTLLFQWYSLCPPQLFSQFLNYPFNGCHLSKKGEEINTLSAVGFFKGKHSSTPELFWIHVVTLVFLFLFFVCFCFVFFAHNDS